MADAPLWTDLLTSWSTLGLLLATGALAAVAWFQIGASRSSAREIFARQARERFLSIPLSYPELADRSVNLSSTAERQKYYAYLSSVFSAFDDASAILPWDIDFQKYAHKILIPHFLFLGNIPTSEWNFHVSREAMNNIRASASKFRARLDTDSKDRAKQLEAARDRMRSKNLTWCIEAADAAVTAGEPFIRSAFMKWDAHSVTMPAANAKMAAHLDENSPEVRALNAEDLSTFNEYFVARKSSKLINTSLEVLDQMLARMDEFERAEGEQDAQS